MQAGFGSALLTPPLGVELAGYGYYLQRCAVRVRDDLYARVLCLDTGKKRFFLISCDVLGLNREIAAAVKAEIGEKYGPADVMLVSIHTHTGPALIDHEGCGVVSPSYVATVAERILAAADAAWEDRVAVTNLSFGMQMLEKPIAYNRASPQGPVDQLVRAFRIERQGAAAIRLISYACHAVCRGRDDAVSADYPGALCRLAAERTIYLNGLCGDIDPIARAGEDAQARTEGFAEAVWKTAQTAAQESLPVAMQSGEFPFVLRLMPVAEADIAGAVARAEAVNGADADATRVVRIWAKEMRAKRPSLTDTEIVTIHYARIGGQWIFALPFEGFTAIGMKIRERLRDDRVLVLGGAEELLGYLPTRDDIARGAYAALESTFLYKRQPVRPGEAERLGEKIGELAAMMADEQTAVN